MLIEAYLDFPPSQEYSPSPLSLSMCTYGLNRQADDCIVWFKYLTPTSMNDVMDELNQYWQLVGLSNMSREGFKGFLSGAEG